MLGDYLTINSQAIPNPVPGSFSYKLNADEALYSNEAGEQMSNVVRLDRLSWAGSFQCTSRIKDLLLSFCKLPQVSCGFLGETHNGRLRLSGEVALYDRSEYTAGTTGLWTVPLVFEEF